MGYNVRKFAIRNQVFGSGPKRRVGIISARTIKVNGVKVKPGQRASGKGALLRKAKGK